MKIASFLTDDGPRYGLYRDASWQLPTDSNLLQCPTLREALTAATTLTENWFTGPELGEDDVRFLPVVPNPDKILCVGVNYRPHIAEMGRQQPSHPVVFMRSSGSLVGHDNAIVKPRNSDQFDYEGELAIIIGRRVRHATLETALQSVFGYTCLMDGSVRDWQRHTSQFTPGKNFPKSGSIGPSVTTLDQLPSADGINLETRVNGKVAQQGQLSDLVFDVASIIVYCSAFSELLPGDVIATGTPGGVGAAQRPPRWLNANDTVEVDISGVGLLRNSVQEESGTDES